VNFSLPKETKAGQHTIKINIYEKEAGSFGEEENITNKGSLNYNIVMLPKASVEERTDFVLQTLKKYN